MRGLFFVVVFLITSFWSVAQQDPMFNKYMFNPLVLNPAYAGSREAISAVLLSRAQWAGFDNAPKTQTFSIHSPLLKNKLGAGFSIMQDQIGPSSSTAIMGSYAYRLRMGPGKLAFGLRTSMYFYRFKWDEIKLKDESDQYRVENQQATTSHSIPSFDFGVWYNTNVFYAGFAASHLVQSTLGKQKIDKYQYNASLVSHLTAVFGYALEINKNLVFKPSVLLKSSDQQIPTVDLNGSFLINKTLWLGVTVRSNFGIVAMAEYNINKNLRFGYSYDISLSKLRNYNSGSHEIFIGYDFNPLKSQTLSSRYF